MQQLVLNAGRMGKVNRPARHSRLAFRVSRGRARKSARENQEDTKRDTGIRMLGYLKLGLAYLALAIAIVFLTRAAPVDALKAVWTTAVSQAPGMTQVAAGLLGLSMVHSVLRRPEGARQIVVAVIAALIGTLAFHSAFGLIKTSMPYIVPFWADPMFAELDRLLHFGVDPWRLSHDLGALLPMEAILPAYLSVWAFPALCLPVFLAAFDRDARRVRRFMLLYVLSWALIGNLLALGFNSAGPIFYDRLLGTERFAEMIAVLKSSPMAGTNIPTIQQNLWTVYVEKGQAFGSGISAFPSVHVSVAMVTGLYAIERSRWSAPFGVLFVAVIQFLSVYTGYHYALDGYVSILVMAGLWAWLRRRDERLAAVPA